MTPGNGVLVSAWSVIDQVLLYRYETALLEPLRLAIYLLADLLMLAQKIDTGNLHNIILLFYD